MTLLVIEEELELSTETIRRNLVKYLGKWKICTRFVPHCLTNDQKALKWPACQEFIQSVHDDLSLLVSVVTGDETWCFQYDPPKKRMNGMLPSSPRHRKF
jgi:hypothetical protein